MQFGNEYSGIQEQFIISHTNNSRPDKADAANFVKFEQCWKGKLINFPISVGLKFIRAAYKRSIAVSE